jgi:hypothetical protein
MVSVAKLTALRVALHRLERLNETASSNSSSVMSIVKVWMAMSGVKISVPLAAVQSSPTVALLSQSLP